MQPSQRYSLQLSEDGTRRTLVDTTTGAVSPPIDGLLLEAQFLLEDDRALVWLTDDAPYEEGLHVYLVRPSAVLEDALHAGAPWSSGILKVLRTGVDWVEFEFFRDGARFRLSVAQEPAFHLLLPKGFEYASRLRRHALSVVEIASKE